MTFVRTHHRGYFIDLEQDVQGWRVAAVTPRVTGRVSTPEQ